MDPSYFATFFGGKKTWQVMHDKTVLCLFRAFITQMPVLGM
jgi:hypothetical protein